MWTVWFHEFLTDTKVHALIVLIAVDLVLGVVVAVKVGNFTLSYIADFARNDVLNKLVPFFTVYAASKFVGGDGVLFGGISFNAISDGVWVLITAAIGGSILGSLKTLGLSQIPAALAGNENAAPPRS